MHICLFKMHQNEDILVAALCKSSIYYTLSQKNDTNSNTYISFMDYPIFIIFYSQVLGVSEIMSAKFKAIW